MQPFVFRPSVFALSATAAVAAALLTAAPARADAAADFYKGKTLSVYVGVSPGGLYSTFAQLLGRHMAKHVPGAPTIVVQHMPGAGGTKAAAFVYNAGPKDGSAVITPNAGIDKRVVLKIGAPKYDPSKFHWLGGWGEAVNTLTVRSDAPVKTIEDAKTKVAVLGSLGKSSNTYMLPSLLNNLVGTKFKIVLGYRGGAPIRNAIEQGELHGWAGQWVGWKLGKPDWVRDGKLTHLVQMASKPSPELPGVPLLSSFARNDDERRIFEFVQTGISDRAFVAPPGVPKDRLAALQTAYMTTLADPEFVAAAAKSSYTVDPVQGATIQKFVEESMAMSPALVDRMRRAMGLEQ
jgi:tripartite-type tricarboxylate transporter receptor subunit TctC